MMKRLVILKKTALILLVALFLINVYIVAQKLVFHNALPGVLGFSPLTVISGSMEPAIKAGDLVVIRYQREYKVGDIVTLRSGNYFVTHRIIDMEQGYVQTKGDANNVADKPVPLSSVEGKVVLIVPGVGRMLLSLKTPLGIAMLTLTGCLLITLPVVSSSLKRNVRDNGDCGDL